MESTIENEEAYDLLLATDLGHFGLMNTIEKEYSVPYELMVCHDEQGVYGLQLSLIMHRFPFEGEEKLIKEIQHKEEEIAALEEYIKELNLREVNFKSTILEKE